ncbi:sulfatase [Formosa agariphila KMM 3901]|uniref:Sulfatase n=1 Tax=Formosa agariphila (strain DSM 15362 / KCTC 12365 / LMG 23005 / KMM 3901 / M-2Alg 35-1) TaxID=1347342 RepID=T2KN05_FORAG|nr:sulfatase-like hydrolase/transferase [Formosa agariphila]CDF79823.1 sulfatase [Formosa agariphila KMM 3901]
MKKLCINFFGFILCSLNLIAQETPLKQPNILWIVTDDQRADALQCYNEATTGKKESALGYVSSPNIDKLAKEGVLFTNAYNNSPACGPSRGSMISGRYPFRTGHFGFELTHQNPDFVKPSFPQILQKEGYVTALFGKGDSYIYKWGPGQGYRDAGHYNYKVHFKHDLQKHDVGDLWAQPVYQKGSWQNIGTEERVKFPDGTLEHYFINKETGELSAEDIQKRKDIEAKFEILRSYTRFNKDLILGGENPLPSGQTVDAKIVEEFKLYLANSSTEFKTTWGATHNGADTNKPLMVNLGFHLPHTPILPPNAVRDTFKKYKYKVPEFSEKELEHMPPQIHRLYKNLNFTNLTDNEKQQAIQDYYAFCAYGDALIGDAVSAFKQYCEKNKQEYLIVFTVGDHGWHLGEQGIEAKFGPWDKSTNGAMIVVSSDKNKVPQGTVQNQFIEYVDIAPTILSSSGIDISTEAYNFLDGVNMFNVIKNNEEVRDYIVGEINLVAGPRAYLRSKDFAFSMRTRPSVKKLKPNENVEWALNCPIDKAELVLYDLRVDPNEHKNLANDKRYKDLSAWFRLKLGNIVLGDGRIECDWSKPNTYNISNFAKGAHDKVLNIPQHIIPKI